MAKLALFDFDGTITNADSLFKFIRFFVGDSKFVFGMLFLSPMLIAYKFRFISNYKAKQYMLTYFFKNTEEKEFKALAKEYSLSHIKEIVRPDAMNRIVWHQKRGHTIVIVSASIKCWLEPWCTQHNIALIATQLEIKEDKLTGKFSTKNCYGIEKERRVTKEYDLNEYEYIYAYGDSAGDKELLSLANESYYKPFRTS